jgi:hypothetical protein
MDGPLPQSSEVAVDRLAGCFDDVTNSYKFFWFLAILEHTKTSYTRIIPIRDLLAQMVTFVWYPANYYLLSFGKQDQLRNLTEQLLNSTSLAVDAKPATVRATAIEQIAHESLVGRELLKLGNYVPYRFLRPFVGDKLRGLADWKVNDAVVAEAERAFKSGPQDSPYRFVDKDAIEFSSPWQRYFSTHHEILTGFCFWRLINYLQRNNPNATNIAGKLFAPERRDLKLGKRFWNTVLRQKGSLTCIYSGKVMTPKNYSLDHFLPWRFVAHDMLWNLIPTPKDVNSAKSDNLPDGALYFDAFARLQYEGVQVIAASGNSALLEDYVLLLRMEETKRLQSLPFNRFQRELHDNIVPQMQIAKNMGFRVNWRYTAV